MPAAQMTPEEVLSILDIVAHDNDYNAEFQRKAKDASAAVSAIVTELNRLREQRDSDAARIERAIVGVKAIITERDAARSRIEEMQTELDKFLIAEAKRPAYKEPM